MSTRHLYTFQNGMVIVLEHISSILPTNEKGKFRIYDITNKPYDVADVEFEKIGRTPIYYRTTERAELIKALREI